jgi:hypothetical protein
MPAGRFRAIVRIVARHDPRQTRMRCPVIGARIHAVTLRRLRASETCLQ